MRDSAYEPVEDETEEYRKEKMTVVAPNFGKGQGGYGGKQWQETAVV